MGIKRIPGLWALPGAGGTVDGGISRKKNTARVNPSRVNDVI